MAAKKTVRKPKKWVAVCWASTGQHLTIRNNPTDEAVRKFVTIQRYRYHNDIPTGPGGGRAHYIESADIWADELKFEQGKDMPVRSIDLNDVPSNPGFPESN